MKIKGFIKTIRDDFSVCGNLKAGINREEVLKKALSYIDFNQCSFAEIDDIVERTIVSLSSDISILKNYVEDPYVDEIMVNGYDCIFLDKGGKLERAHESFLDTSELEEVIRRIAGKLNREINENSPILDARLEDGSRVCAIYKNIAIGGPTLNIRKFKNKLMSMEELIKRKMFTEEQALFLTNMVKEGKNIFISGGTSTGKTTLLKALCEKIPKDERVIVLEDSGELRIENLPNIVSMECRKATSNSISDITMSDLIKASLRMRPDRLIIGEIRDGEALINMINGLNTGHSGMCTGHSNSAESMVRRMEAMYLQEKEYPITAIHSQICEAVNIIVHLCRDYEGNRKVESISKILLDENKEICLKKIF